MKITIAKIDELVPAVQAVLKKYPDSKIEYACKKVIKSIQKITNSFNDDVEDERVSLAQEKDGVLLRDLQGNYVFSRENQKILNAKYRDLRNKDYELNPYYTTSVPEDLSQDIIDDLVGIIINPEE